MKTIVVTQATTRPFKRVKSTHFRKEKDHQLEHQQFVTLGTKKKPQLKHKMERRRKTAA
jgi:hypothetical protein